MYGSVMLIAACRSGVIVIAPMPMSHFFAWKAAPEVTWAHSMLTTSCSRPRSLATRSSRSTSKPTTLVPSLYWNGLYGRWVQTISLPDFTRVIPAAAALSSVPPLPEFVAAAGCEREREHGGRGDGDAGATLAEGGDDVHRDTPRHWNWYAEPVGTGPDAAS